MTASRPWSDTDDELTLLLQKINNYLVFALDEGLVRAYPEAAGKPLRFQLDCVAPPTDSVQQVIAHTAERLREYGIGFTVNALP